MAHVKASASAPTAPAPKASKGPRPLTVTVENGRLIIDAPIDKPRPSASGKTMVVVSTHGNVDTGAEYEGEPLIMGLNVYYRA
jgi:hypothetical protein